MTSPRASSWPRNRNLLSYSFYTAGRFFTAEPPEKTFCLLCSAQSISHVQLFVISWTAALQASLSISNSYQWANNVSLAYKHKAVITWLLDLFQLLCFSHVVTLLIFELASDFRCVYILNLTCVVWRCWTFLYLAICSFLGLLLVVIETTLYQVGQIM